jgi:hypothetical protein
MSGLAVTVDQNRVRIGERFSISFQRTLRIPDDGRVYPLPPSLEAFPIRRVDDYRERVSTAWRERGGVFIPMYQREALWLAFQAAKWKPNAVKIGVGGVNAVSGEIWNERLNDDPQDYVVCPTQPWLDGIASGRGTIRQFVATPLGAGYTVEAQLTGSEETGGLQVLVFEPKPGRFPDTPPPEPEPRQLNETMISAESVPPVDMGLAAGGEMTQKIYPDPYGIETWDQSTRAELFVHIVNSEQYEAITGEEPPPSPIDAHTYTAYGFPWFVLYEEDRATLEAGRLATVKSIGELDADRGLPKRKEDKPLEIHPDQTKTLRPHVTEKPE